MPQDVTGAARHVWWFRDLPIQLSEEVCVIPWVHLGSAPMPGGGELRLMQRGSEFSIMLGAVELMNSRRSGSEEALARLACERLQDHARPRMLIGGLGMGFTLRAALAGFDGLDGAAVTVAELVPEVVAWARGPMAALFGACLDDPHVTLHQGDVGPLIASSARTWDAILLDVDNGPEGLTRKANDDIYSAAGLGLARAALAPGGLLTVWSSAPNAPFTARLKQAGFAVEEVRARATRQKRGGRHVIWLATNGRN